MNSFSLEKRVRPVVKWAGGKTGPLSQLVGHFPKNFNRYFEPFLGGGAAFLALRPGVPAVINDFNAELMALYMTIRDCPQELMEQLDHLASHYSEKFYYDLRQSILTDPVSAAARTLFLNKTGFNGLYRLNSKGGFNVPFGKRPACPTLYHKSNLLAASLRLRNAEIRNEDFELVIGAAGPGDFVYCDPPYEPLSQSACFTAYTASGFSQADQLRLRCACQSAVDRGASVAVSNSSAAFILELFAHWRLKKIVAKRAINSQGHQRGEIREVLALLGGNGRTAR